MTRSDLAETRGWRAIAAYVAVWALATGYFAARGGDWSVPIASLGIFGIALSAIIWFLTRKMDPSPVPVARPARESVALLVYLGIYAVLLIGILLGTLKQAIPAGPTQEVVVLAYKLVIHVAIPAAIIVMVGGTVRPLLDAGIKRRGFWSTLIVLGLLMIALLAVVSPSLKEIGALNLTPGALIPWLLAAFAWIAIEAGLCEEFLFRACLQSRLTAWLQSPAAAIVASSLLFALAHWPGLYFRGGPGVDGWSSDPLQVAAFTIATLSPLSIALGLLWARSRSLLLVVMVHAAIDVLPFTSEFVKLWG